jgi:uncharacterized protein YecE (DUF72 family)
MIPFLAILTRTESLPFTLTLPRQTGEFGGYGRTLPPSGAEVALFASGASEAARIEMSRGQINVGIAGWALRSEQANDFPAAGTHLARYAARYPAVEINSSFYRPHLAKTYARWAASVPDAFRFAVKVPKAVTHTQRLRDSGALDLGARNLDALVEQFAQQTANLGVKLGVWLVQLPPSLAFDEPVARNFFGIVRLHYQGRIAFEPRHRSWFADEGESLLNEFGIARVAADPAIIPAAAHPAGATDLVYYRLHGSPRMYYSAYNDVFLRALAAELQARSAAGGDVWCIFDNTADGFAHVNASQLQRLLDQSA